MRRLFGSLQKACRTSPNFRWLVQSVSHVAMRPLVGIQHVPVHVVLVGCPHLSDWLTR